MKDEMMRRIFGVLALLVGLLVCGPAPAFEQPAARGLTLERIADVPLLQAGFPSSGRRGSGVVVWNNLQTFSGTGQSSGIGSSNIQTFVTKVQPGGFGTSSGSSIRITITQSALSSSATILAVTACPSGGGNAWSCSVTPTTITFTGVPGVLLAGQSIVSNSIPYTLAGGTPLAIALDLDTGSNANFTFIPITYVSNVTTNTNPTKSTTACGGAKCFVSYRRSGVNQAGSAARGSSYNTEGDFSIFVSKIEVQ